MDLRVSIYKIYKFAGKTKSSRSIVEGEKLVNAGHVVLCVIKEKTESTITINGLCLQTSALKGNPYSIDILFKVSSNELNIDYVKCACIAGLNGSCKHSMAVLICCNRNNVLEFDEMSSTDLQCTWKNKKKDTMAKFAPVTIQDFYCVEKLHQRETYTEAERVWKKFISAFPNSILAKHNKRKRSNNFEEPQPSTSGYVDQRAKILGKIFDASIVSVDLKDELNNFLTENILEAYGNIKVNTVKARKIALETIFQNDQNWMRERKKRFTGSVCYEIFTYTHNKSPQWEKKLKSIFWGTLKVNDATNYGTVAEKEAISVCREKGMNIINLGFIVHPELPWLGYSPDGFILENEELILVEVKCPVSGQAIDISTVVNNLSYLQFQDNGVCTLKIEHKYYAQVQLGMALSGAKKCAFIVYSTFSKKFFRLDVNYDSNFAIDLIKRITPIYFTYMLPLLVKMSWK